MYAYWVMRTYVDKAGWSNTTQTALLYHFIDETDQTRALEQYLSAQCQLEDEQTGEEGE